jgi:uncharacterized protein (DUF433 family)
LILILSRTLRFTACHTVDTMKGAERLMETNEIIDRGRGPELARIRITVYDVLHYLEAGHDAAYIATVLPISVEEVQAFQRYIDAHRAEVMAEHRKIEDRLAKGNPPEVEARLRRSPWRARLQAKWDEIQAKRGGAPNGEGNPFGS